MSQFLAVTALTVCSALAVGSVFALLGTLKLALARRPDHADDRVRFHLLFLNALLIPLFLLAGYLVDSIGVRPTLIAGSILLTLSFLAFSAGLGYGQTIAAVFAASFGAACLGICSLLLFPRGLFGVREVAASLQLGFVFISLGALITPPLFDLSFRFLGFRRTAAFFALLLLLPACIAALPPNTHFPAKANGTGTFLVFSDATIWAAGLVFFCYAPLEAFVSVWTTTYLTNANQSHRTTRWLAGFWGMMLFSRLLLGILQHVGYFGDTYPSWFLVIPALLAAVILGNMSGATRNERALPGLLLLGFVLGPLYPLLLGMLEQTQSIKAGPGMILALLFVAGSLGSLALSPLVNLSLKSRTVFAAMRIPLLIALVLTAMTLLFTLLASGRME